MSEKSLAATTLKRLRERTGLSVRYVAEHVSKSGSGYAYYEDEYKKEFLPFELIKELIPLFREGGVEPEELMALAGVTGVVPRPTARPAPATLPPPKNGVIREVEVRGGLGGGGISFQELNVSDEHGNTISADLIRGEWSIPSDYLSTMLRGRTTEAYIMEVEGDSMKPTIETGDRVMVDTSRRIPSPAGIFAIWDGLAVVVKRIEYVQNSDPQRVVIISDNAIHKPYERTVDEAAIIGRVIWFARRL